MLKQKVCKAIRNEKEPDDFRFLIESKKIPNEQYSSLDDDVTVEELGFNDDTILYISYWISKGDGEGEWETVNVPDYPTSQDEEGK